MLSTFHTFLWNNELYATDMSELIYFITFCDKPGKEKGDSKVEDHPPTTNSSNTEEQTF